MAKRRQQQQQQGNQQKAGDQQDQQQEQQQEQQQQVEADNLLMGMEVDMEHQQQQQQQQNQESNDQRMQAESDGSQDEEAAAAEAETSQQSPPAGCRRRSGRQTTRTQAASTEQLKRPKQGSPYRAPPTYSGKYLLFTSPTTGHLAYVALLHNGTWEQAGTFEEDNPWSDHVREAHQDLCRLETAEEAIRLAIKCRLDRKCPLCQKKFPEKMEVDDEGEDVEGDEGNEEEELPHLAGLGANAYDERQSDVLFSGTFDPAEGVHFGGEQESRWPIHWSPAWFRVFRRRGRRDGRLEYFVPWGRYLDGLLSLNTVVPKELQAKVDGALAEISDQAEATIGSKYCVYRPLSESTVRLQTGEVDLEEHRKELEKAGGGGPWEVKAPPREAWETMLVAMNDLELKSVTEREKKWFGLQENEEGHLPSPPNGCKYYGVNQETGYKQNPNALMNDLTQHSVLISREVLEEEFGLTLAQTMINFPDNILTPDELKTRVAQVGEMFALKSQGAQIQQEYHGEECKSNPNCPGLNRLQVKSEIKSKASQPLSKVLEKVFKQSGGKDPKLNCGDPHVFNSNFSLTRKDNGRIYAEVAKLPAELAMNDPSADGCIGVLLPLGGINELQLYIKLPWQYTAVHQENSLLISANLNIGSADCRWYCLEEKYRFKLEKLMADNNLKHGTPFRLDALGRQVKEAIPEMYEIVQRPGELVVIPPATWHFVISEGYTANIAWNAAPYHAASLGAMMRSVHLNALHREPSVVPVVATLLHLGRHLINGSEETRLWFEKDRPGKAGLVEQAVVAGAKSGSAQLDRSRLKIDPVTAGMVFLFLLGQLRADYEMVMAFAGRFDYRIIKTKTEDHMGKNSSTCASCKAHLWNGRIFFAKAEKEEFCHRCASIRHSGQPEENGGTLKIMFSLRLIKRLITVFFKLATGAKEFVAVEEFSADGNSDETRQPFSTVWKVVDNSSESEVFVRKLEKADRVSFRLAQLALLEKHCNPSGLYHFDPNFEQRVVELKRELAELEAKYREKVSAEDSAEDEVISEEVVVREYPSNDDLRAANVLAEEAESPQVSATVESSSSSSENSKLLSAPPVKSAEKKFDEDEFLTCSKFSALLAAFDSADRQPPQAMEVDKAQDKADQPQDGKSDQLSSNLLVADYADENEALNLFLAFDHRASDLSNTANRNAFLKSMSKYIVLRDLPENRLKQFFNFEQLPAAEAPPSTSASADSVSTSTLALAALHLNVATTDHQQPVIDEQPMEIAEFEQLIDSSASDQVEVEVEVEVENVEDIDELQQQQELPNEDYDDSSNIDNSIPVEETAAIEKEAETVAEEAAAEVEAEVIEVSANAEDDNDASQQQPQQQQQPFETVPVALSGSPDTVPINENEQVDSSPSLVPCSPSSYITVSPSLSSPSPSSSPSSSSSAFSGSANINTIESNNSTGDESTAKDAADELASDQAASQSLKESAADKLSAQVVVDSNATAATDGEEESDDEMDENDEEEDLNESEYEYEDDDNEDDNSEAADVPADAAAAAAAASAPVFPDPQVNIDLPPVYRQQNDSSLRKRSAPSAETVRNEYDQQGDFGEDRQDSLDSPSEEDLYRFSVKRLRKRPEELLLTSNDPMLSSTPLCHNSNFRLYNPSPANARVFALLLPPPPPPPPPHHHHQVSPLPPPPFVCIKEAQN